MCILFLVFNPIYHSNAYFFKGLEEFKKAGFFMGIMKGSWG